MTDKQIIIDDVDITKCEYHSKLLEGVCTFYGRCAKTFCPYKAKWLKEQLLRKEQECEELKKQLESTKGLVTVGNRQLAEALLELQTYKDKEQKEKEENEKLYKKLEGSCLIGKHWRFK